jgi:transcriptional regulator
VLGGLAPGNFRDHEGFGSPRDAGSFAITAVGPAAYAMGMYLPRHFTVIDLAQITAFVDAAQSADLVTFDGTKPVSTLLPVIWDRPDSLRAAPGAGTEAGVGTDVRTAGGAGADVGDGGEAGFGRLLGHIAIANDQWKTAQPRAQALAIVHGPQAYISPSWYEAKARHGRVVPTWNYEAVHLTGAVTFHQDPEWLRHFVTRLTRRHEGGREHPWAPSDAPPEYIDGQLRAIVGVELTITAIEAKQKLSQNRSELDREGVVAGLRGEPGQGPAAIAAAMAAQLTSGDGA